MEYRLVYRMVFRVHSLRFYAYTITVCKIHLKYLPDPYRFVRCYFSTVQ